SVSAALVSGISKQQKPVLCKTLENLIENDFKKFKWMLENITVQGYDMNIPKCSLEKADCLTTIDILINFYGEDAIHVATKTLKEINQNELAAQLSKEYRNNALTQTAPASKKKCSVKELLPKYLAQIQRDHGTITSYNADPGKRMDLSSQYITLLITKRCRQKEEREKSLLSECEEILTEMKAEKDNCIQIEGLFTSELKKKAPKIVVFHGAPGIGKTLTTKKIMLDWASGRLYKDTFKYVFYLNCRELNQIPAEEKLSATDLIFRNAEALHIVRKKILQKSENILVVVDGFDELKFSLEDTTQVSGKTAEDEVYPIELTISKLLSRKVLPQISMIITARSEALEKLEACANIDHYAEILGFSEEEKMQYFHNFFQDDQQALQAFNHIKENKVFFTMCYIPVISWIVCTALKDQMKPNSNFAQNLETTTELFLNYTYIIKKHHRFGSTDLNEQLFQKLGTLAFKGVMKQQMIFDVKDLEDVQLDPERVPSSFLNKMTYKVSVRRETAYSFVHFSFQEFFAALHCTADKNRTEANILLEEFLKEGKGHLIAPVQFLFGLANSKSAKIIHQSISENFRSEMLGWIRKMLSQEKDYNFLQLLYCLYEIHEADFVSHAMQDHDTLDLSNVGLKETDCMVISYCFQ
uniref:NACHT domain-containing protein n=1 Tax=Latimeria chalumnae TaxID=7897 RepID=H3A1B6_LATCH